MGRDPKTSVLNEHNQAHDVKNLFFDARRPAWVPIPALTLSLTYMALNRACLRLRRLSQIKKTNYRKFAGWISFRFARYTAHDQQTAGDISFLNWRLTSASASQGVSLS